MTDNSFASPVTVIRYDICQLISVQQFWAVSQDASDVLYSNGLKIPTQMVLEVDALPKY